MYAAILMIAPRSPCFKFEYRCSFNGPASNQLLEHFNNQKASESIETFLPLCTYIICGQKSLLNQTNTFCQERQRQLRSTITIGKECDFGTATNLLMFMVKCKLQ